MTSPKTEEVVLITGATEGIGRVAARELARRGGHVVLIGRNREKTLRVTSEIARETGNTRMHPLVADLSSLAEIRAAAAAFRRDYARLDILVNNAGAMFETYQLSADGFEQTFALNHLGYFCLTNLLLDVLKATPGSRVVSTSSAAHRMGRMDLATIAKREPTRRAGFAAYGDSKLANILFTTALARRLGPGHAANCFHPGFVRSGFGRNNHGVGAMLFALAARLLARSPEQGAETLLWLATSPEAGASSGGYFRDKHAAGTAKLAQDSALAEQLWTLSESLCSTATPTESH